MDVELDLDLVTAGRVVGLADPTLRPEAVTRLDGGAARGVFAVRSSDGREVVVKAHG